MPLDLGKARQSLEEIALKAKEIKDSLLPIERRIRDSYVEVPKGIILSSLYRELLTIQRVARIKKDDDRKEAILTDMEGRAIFPFAVALYMPLRQEDATYNYNDFYRGFVERTLTIPGLVYSNSLDLLLLSQNPNPLHNMKTNLPSVYVLLDKMGIRLEEDVVNRINPNTLKDLQYFHNLEANQFIEAYINLLREIRDKLHTFAEFDLEGLKERYIPTNIPNIPIKIFPEGQLKLVYQEEERRIIQEMMQLDNWDESLEAIKNFITDVKYPKSGHLRRYRVLSTDSEFTPVVLSPARKRESIIGIDDNLKKLEALVRGYAKGKSTPHIVLLGIGGVGKTTSLMYVMETTTDIKNIKYFLMDSLADMQQIAKLSDSYKSIGVIDDMRGELNPIVYSNIKRQLEGLEDVLFNRVLVIISATPEIWSQIDEPIKQRLGGVELKYEPNPQSYDKLVRIFCQEFNVEYKSEMVEQVKDMVPRQVRDFIRAFGSEQAGLVNKIS